MTMSAVTMVRFVSPSAFAFASMNSFCVALLETAVILDCGYIWAIQRDMDPQPHPSSRMFCLFMIFMRRP